MSNYLNNYKDSTDVVESKNRMSKKLLLFTYLIIWSISVIIFWLFVADGDGFLYGIYLMTILPLTTFILSFIIQRNNYWEEYRWLFILGFGIMFMLSEYATFSAGNMIEFNKFNLPDFTMIIFGSLISLAGMFLGKILNKKKV